jgi:TolB protein
MGQAAQVVDAALWTEPVTASVGVNPPYTFAPLTSVTAPDARLSERVTDAFGGLRRTVAQAAGWDFLGVLSDMTRQLAVGVCGDGCEIMSWHKTGRAVDTRLSVVTGGVSMLEIAREDMLGETYWRIYLRAAKQDGTEGEPLTQAPWDWTYRARWTLAPHEGGVPKAIPTGYYVDFTELAREYGWNRISSYDDPTLSWKENNLGMEFWHFQKNDGKVWYAAENELYSSDTLASVFDWNDMLRQKQDEYLLPLKGIPAPPVAWPWFALSP